MKGFCEDILAGCGWAVSACNLGSIKAVASKNNTEWFPQAACWPPEQSPASPLLSGCGRGQVYSPRTDMVLSGEERTEKHAVR